MSCIDAEVPAIRVRAERRRAAFGICLLLAGCGSTPLPPAPWGGSGSAAGPNADRGRPEPKSDEPAAARDWAEYKRRAALRIVELNLAGSYVGEVPPVLLAIPVLEIEVDADGAIRRIDVLRTPKAGATDTVELAIAAVRRAAPFGSVRHLPKPWRFAEAFLFDDDRRFKPRTLDE